MGLIARAKHLMKVDEFKDIFVEVFGISIEEAKKRLSDEPVQRVEVSNETKAKIEENNKKIMSPQQLVEVFAEQTEEFYPDGNAPKH